MDPHDRLTDRRPRLRYIALAAALASALPALAAAADNGTDDGPDDNPTDDSTVEASAPAAATRAALERIEALIGELRKLAGRTPEIRSPAEPAPAAPPPVPDGEAAPDAAAGILPVTVGKCGPIRKVQAEGTAWIDNYGERHDNDLRALDHVNNALPTLRERLESDDIDTMCDQRPVEGLRSLQDLLAGLPLEVDRNSGIDIAVCAEQLARAYETTADSVRDPDLETLYANNRRRLGIIIEALYERDRELAVAWHKQQRLARELSDLLRIAQLQCAG